MTNPPDDRPFRQVLLDGSRHKMPVSIDPVEVRDLLTKWGEVALHVSRCIFDNAIEDDLLKMFHMFRWLRVRSVVIFAWCDLGYCHADPTPIVEYLDLIGPALRGEPPDIDEIRLAHKRMMTLISRMITVADYLATGTIDRWEHITKAELAQRMNVSGKTLRRWLDNHSDDVRETNRRSKTILVKTSVLDELPLNGNAKPNGNRT